MSYTNPSDATVLNLNLVITYHEVMVRLCCHPFSYEIVQDVKYGNNSRMSALFWILSP